jgi:osmotically-inducible protein OsmY
MATGIPSNTPPVAPPAAPLSPPPDQTPLTLRPAAGVGEARTSAALVPPSPTQNQPDTAQDQESIKEIRALLAADRALAPLANQVTIVARSGRVWLRGQVNTKEQRAAIERVARQAAGVVNVKNELVAME